jgi:hypothetical protein
MAQKISIQCLDRRDNTYVGFDRCIKSRRWGASRGTKRVRCGCHRDVFWRRWSFAGYRIPLRVFFVHTDTYIGFRTSTRRHTASIEIDKNMCDNSIGSLLLLLGWRTGEREGWACGD